MKHLIYSFLFPVLFCSVTFGVDHEPTSISQMARATVNEVWKRIEDCGLERRNAHDPELPKPLVPALEAVVKAGFPEDQVLAYYDEELGGEDVYVFKNWQGGHRHSVKFTEEHIKFVTPYAGTIARANRVKTVDGYRFYLYCRTGRPVSAETFQGCVDEAFVSVIVEQLCSL